MKNSKSQSILEAELNRRSLFSLMKNSKSQSTLEAELNRRSLFSLIENVSIDLNFYNSKILLKTISWICLKVNEGNTAS